MKLVISMSFCGARSPNIPRRASIVTGTVIFWHFLASATLASVARAAAAMKDFIVIYIYMYTRRRGGDEMPGTMGVEVRLTRI